MHNAVALNEAAATRGRTRALMGDAVYRNRLASRDGLLERLFALAFTNLVYPQIWEDPEVDMQALRITPDSRIVTIASGGCNVLSYLTARPQPGPCGADQAEACRRRPSARLWRLPSLFWGCGPYGQCARL
jgi:Protein of unknown function (DUF3419)